MLRTSKHHVLKSQFYIKKSSKKRFKNFLFKKKNRNKTQNHKTGLYDKPEANHTTMDATQPRCLT